MPGRHTLTGVHICLVLSMTCLWQAPFRCQNSDIYRILKCILLHAGLRDLHGAQEHAETRAGLRAQVRALAEKYFGAWRGAAPQPAAALPAYACQCSACAAEAACAAPATRAAAASSPAFAGSAAAAGMSMGMGTAALERPGSGRGDAAGACGVDGAGCTAQPQVADGERRLEMPARAGPAVMQAYYRPSLHSPDAVTLDVVWCAPCAVPWPDAGCRYLSHSVLPAKLPQLTPY